MRSAHAVGLGILLALTAPGVRAQTNPSGQNPPKPSGQAPAKPATQTPAKPAAQAPPASKPAPPAAKVPGQTATGGAKPGGQAGAAAAKPVAKPPAKPARKAPPQAKPSVKPPRAAKKSAKPTAKPTRKPGGTGKPPQSEVRVARRDPFESLIGRQRNAGEAAKNLPPGIHGLQVSTLRLDGVVRAPNGMIAVVTNPQSRTYFLREGDQLYDGSVEKITMDSVSFHEVGKDAFGRAVERQVNKRIYASPGEQQ